MGWGIRRAVVTGLVAGGLLFTSGCLGDDDGKDGKGGKDGGNGPQAPATPGGDTGKDEGTGGKGEGQDDGKGDGKNEGAGDKPLKVTGVYLIVAPGTVSGMKCNTALLESFMGTITFEPGHKGGEIKVRYGASSGGMKDETIQVPPGAKSVNKNFTYSEMLFGGSIAAGQLNVLEPNIVGSATVRPTGTCTPGGMWGDTGYTGGGGTTW